MKEIKRCVVIDKKKENDDKYLVCYYISSEEISSNNIRKFLISKLPRYMVPNYYIRIYDIPLSSSGKLNRKELPEPNNKDFITEEYIEPETEIEKVICKIYSDLFNIPENQIGRMSDFYELGGDSLNAIRIISTIEKELNVKIYIKDIMSYSIISDLGKFIEKLLNDNNRQIEIIEKHNKKEFPVTSQQLGVYIDSIKNPNSVLYNIPSIFKLNKNLNIEKIKEGFNELFKKQEIFRTKYYEKEIHGKTEIYGYIDDKCLLKFEEYSYDNVNTFVRPFNLSEAPLIRVGFINDEVLLIDMHHIISDGTTILIILNEINKFYYDKEMEEIKIQFSDYAIDLNEKKDKGYFKKEIEFYKDLFSNEYDTLNIPKIKDSINNKMQYENDKVNSNVYNHLVDKSTSILINKFIKKHNLSKTAFFLTIYGYVLSKYSGQDSIYTSIITANRNNHYVENMAGMFVSTLPLLLKYIDCESSLLNIIKKNMETLINIYNNQHISFSELADTLKLKKINNSFVFQPVASSQNTMNNDCIFDLKNENLDIFSIYENQNELNKNNNTKFDMTFNIIENKDDYLISIAYNTHIYDLKIIKNIIESYIEILKNFNNFESNIKNIEYIPNDEKEKIIKEFNSDSNKYECNKLYHEEFSEIAKSSPEKCAI
eukprot:jgi/Orpsp1_1/1192005/evm.model.d7180000089941.1